MRIPILMTSARLQPSRMAILRTVDFTALQALKARSAYGRHSQLRLRITLNVKPTNNSPRIHLQPVRQLQDRCQVRRFPPAFGTLAQTLCLCFGQVQRLFSLLATKLFLLVRGVGRRPNFVGVHAWMARTPRFYGPERHTRNAGASLPREIRWGLVGQIDQRDVRRCSPFSAYDAETDAGVVEVGEA